LQREEEEVEIEEQHKEEDNQTISQLPSQSTSTIEDPNFRTRNVSRGLGSLAIQNVITSILAFVFLSVLLRLTSPVDYTAYSSVLVSIGVAVTVSTFALQFAAARYIAMYSVQDEKKAWAVAKSIFVLSLIFSLAAAAAFEVISPELSTYFMKSTQFVSVFEIGGIWLFTLSLSTVIQGIIQGMKKYVLLAKMITISKVVMLVFAIVTLEVYHNIDFALASWILYCLILIIWPTTKIGWRLFQKSETGYYSEVMRYSAPLAITAIFGIVSASGDSIIIGGYTNSLGPYNTAILISGTLSLVLVMPLTTALLPEAASSLGKKLEISNVIRLAMRFMILGLLPSSLLMAALAKQLLSLFSGGGSYLSAQEALQIISITYIFCGVQSLMCSLLQAIGKTIRALISGIAAAVADAGIAFLLVPGLGMIGGATSRSLEALVGMIVSIYFVRRYLRNLDAPNFYVKGIVASLIPFIPVFSLSLFVSSKTLTLIPYSIIGVAIFLACVKSFNLLNEGDVNFFTHVIPGRFHFILEYIAR
jgi:O-antigen/teichoic acid export membrane protein